MPPRETATWLPSFFALHERCGAARLIGRCFRSLSLLRLRLGGQLSLCPLRRHAVQLSAVADRASSGGQWLRDEGICKELKMRGKIQGEYTVSTYSRGAKKGTGDGPGGGTQRCAP